MADFITTAELKTHLYEENANEISRSDEQIIEDAIEAAIDEVEGYLMKYDVDKIFKFTAAAGYTIDNYLAQRNKKLLSTTKDVAVWHLIRLSNPNIETQFRRVLYEDAVSWLERVQSGKISPTLPLPVIDETQTGGDLVGEIKWSSNRKRKNHF